MRNELNLGVFEEKRNMLKRSPGMKVSELSSRIEKFHADLVEHADLWRQSLDHALPDYPITNGSKLREQVNALARQLGMLRPYRDKFGFPTTMGMVAWSGTCTTPLFLMMWPSARATQSKLSFNRFNKL
jgi:hypothetical protein